MSATPAIAVTPVEEISDASDVLDRAPLADEERFRLGTLRYTRFGLAMLFVWLLWGDFCFTLMETVIPSVLPLKLQSLDASNVLIGLLMSSIPSALNVALNPIVSFRSDRYRSRMGRRIPFLFWATPPLTLCLVLLGYSESIGGWLHRAVMGPLFDMSPTATVLGVIAVFMFAFQVCNMFVATVYYYLFNDVVPQAFLGRFMSLFRIMGVAATTLFSFFIFPHAQSHMKEIFVGTGVLYFAAFMLMCWKVREGSYPDPPANLGNDRGLVAAAKTYFVECFTRRFYWDFFLANAFWAVAGAVTMFVVYNSLAIGLTTGDLGKIAGVAGIVGVVLLYPAGILSDRFHPLRMLIVATALIVLFQPLNLIWLVVEPTPTLAWRVSVLVAVLTVPLGVLWNAAQLPMYMRLLPKERFGQFGSADAMVRSLMLIVAGPVAGLIMDWLKWFHDGDPYYYRYAPFWSLSMQVLSLVFLVRVYRQWARLGGDASFVPPDAVKPSPVHAAD